MTNDDAAPLAVTREDLYELVWSKPTIDLAKDFGISNVALAKRCKTLRVPVPGRGYWARVDAGQKPYRPRLPRRQGRYGDRRALKLTAAERGHGAEGNTETVDGCGIRARIEALTLSTSSSILGACPMVKRTAWRLEHPRRVELSFSRAEKWGHVISITTLTGVLDRALLVADTVVKAAEALGWRFIGPPRPPEGDGAEGDSVPDAKVAAAPGRRDVFGEFLVNRERIGFQIEERYRDEKRRPTRAELAREKKEWGYKAPRTIAKPTGTLRLVGLDTYQSYGGLVRHTWYDRRGLPVERQVKELLLGFYELSLSIKARRVEDERQERRRQEEERVRKERQARRAGHAALIRQLETDAGAWHRARFLRRYIQAARARIGAGAVPARFADGAVNFFDWAEEYVNQLDPLHALPRSGEFGNGKWRHYEADQAKESFERLLGSHWGDAWKFGMDYRPEPDGAPDLGPSYRERSVFAVDKGVREEE